MTRYMEVSPSSPAVFALTSSRVSNCEKKKNRSLNFHAYKPLTTIEFCAQIEYLNWPADNERLIPTDVERNNQPNEAKNIKMNEYHIL